MAPFLARAQRTRVSAQNPTFVDTLMLAVVGLFTGGDILLAARVLLAFLFGANLVLFSFSVYMCTKRSLVATGCGMLFFLLSEPTVFLHSMALSEAPFIAFSMTGFFLFAQHIVLPSPRCLVLSSLMIGLAAATRYMGVILLPTLALSLFLLSGQSLRYKIRDVSLFSSIAILPLSAWFIRNILTTQSTTSRVFLFHPVGFTHVKDLITSTYLFILPIGISGLTKAMQLGAVAILFILAAGFIMRENGVKERRSSIEIVLPSILIVYSVLYVLFLFFAISFFDADTSPSHRTLLPVLFAIIVVCTSVARALSDILPQACVWHAFVCFMVFSISANAVPAISRAATIHRNGHGYSSRCWRDSATLAYLSRVPETMTIYSNAVDAIRFLTQKDANSLPAKICPLSLRKNGGYQDGMDRIIRECEKGDAVIVYFDRKACRSYFPSKEEIGLLFSRPLAKEMEDGVVYGVTVLQDEAEGGAAQDGGGAAPDSLREH